MGPDAPPAGGTGAALRAIWERHREGVLEQVGTVERAAVAALQGKLDARLRDEARREAHKLAGSLGTFGFPTASERAKRLELLLGNDDGAELDARELSELVVELRAAVEGGAAPPPSPAPAPAPVESTAAHDDAPLVLVVEDDSALAERLSAEAARRGLRVELAATPAAAGAASTERPPDLALLDLTFDGETAAAYELLSDLTTRTPPVPVLVLTVRDVFTDRVEVARRGGRGFVPKSTPPEQVLDQVEQLLERVSAANTTLLAVDDDPAMLDAIRATLEPEGLQVATLSEPLRFWEELGRVGPDIVMLDIDMPDVSGIELCRVMRNDSRWAALPVVFLTSRRDEPTVRDLFGAGADDYLLKPVIGEELVWRVRSRLERSRIHRFLAERDALTSVRNRPSSTQAIERLVAMAKRYEQPLTFALVDLDHFKSVNDTHGHAAGDAVLRRLGEHLLQAFRGEDVVGRWGGEEFVVGMYGMTRDDALRRVRGLLAGFEREVFYGAQGEPFHVAFSAGVAAFPEHGEDVPALHRAADAALYDAKESGRGRAHAAGDPVSASTDRPDVVVVEDDEALVDVLVHSLETRGHRVHALGDGAEASAALAGPAPQLRPRVVVLDVDLPALDGVAVLRRLGATGVLRSTKVIMLTGHSSEQSVLETLELGAVDHLRKPFSVPVLMHKVAQALEAARSSPRAS